MYGTLCVFSTLFGHSLSERASGKLDSNVSYLLWLGVFASIVIPLSCKNLEASARAIAIAVLFPLSSHGVVLWFCSISGVVLTAIRIAFKLEVESNHSKD